jgi:hypothetical protein
MGSPCCLSASSSVFTPKFVIRSLANELLSLKNFWSRRFLCDSCRIKGQ